MSERDPAIPAYNGETPNGSGLLRVLQAMKERLEVYGRDRGSVESSMVRVQDLIDLGLISREDLLKLRRSA